MNKLLYILILCVGFSLHLHAQEDFRKTAPKGGPAPKIELGASTSFQLKNGLTVVVVENHRLPRVNFQLLVDVPPIIEGDKAGTASIAGQLLRSGTTKRSKAEIDEAVDFIGANLNASSGGVFASSLTKHTDALLGIMKEVLLMPSFPKDEFDKIIDQTKSGLAANENDPSVIASRVADVLRYGADHPYGEFITEKTVDNISLEDVKQYYQTYFKPNISYLVIVGDVKAKKAKKLAKKYFGSWEKGAVAKPTFTNPDAPQNTKVVLVNRPGLTQSIINVTYPVYLKPSSTGRMAGRVMNAILGGGTRGRLFLNLREDKGYTYGAYSSLSSDPEVGYFTASASVRNEVTDSAIIEILYEMNQMRTKKVSADILQERKNELTGSFAMSTESPQSIANYALSIMRYGLNKDHYETYLKRLQAVTADDIMAAAKKFITPDHAYIFVVGNQDEVLDQLKNFGEVEILDIYGQPVKAPTSAGNMTAQGVIDNYLKAIGGKEKLMALKDLTLELEANIQGQAMTTKVVKKAPNKMLVEASMMGQVVQKIVFDGEKGSMSMMGQNQAIEGEAAAGMKEQATIIPELGYDESTAMELSGVEELDGKSVYVLKMSPVAGTNVAEYFYKDSGLKARTVTMATTQGQTVTTTVDYSDYKEVDGVMIPHVQKTSGGPMPFPIEMKVTAVKVNADLSDDLFKVE